MNPHRESAPARPEVAAGPHRLVGRAGESLELRRLLAEAGSGRGQAVLLTGEAGIGKTRLAEEVVRTARRAGFFVMAGAAEELDRRRPFGAVADALGIGLAAGDKRQVDLARRLLGVEMGQIQPLDLSPMEEYGLVEAVVSFVEELWTPGPAVLVIENLHWADPSTVRCVRRLVKMVTQQAALLLLTARPDGIDVRGLVDPSGGMAELRLEPLDAADVAAYAGDLLDATPGPRLLAQLERAGGNPLFVIELVAVLEGEGSVRRLDGTAELVDEAAPASLPLTILHRLSVLPPDTLELLSLGAVLGSTFSVNDLSLLSRRPVVELTAPLRSALRAGILTEDGDRLAFRHDLIHSTLYEDLPASLRRGLHRELGHALAARHADPYRVAEHLARGAEAGDRHAVEWLHRAGREAATKTPVLGVELLERALDLADDTDPDVAAIRADLAVALVWADRNLEGEALARRVLAGDVDRTRAGWLSQWLAGSLVMRGEVAAAALLARQALESGEVHGHTQRLLLCIEAISAVFMGDRDTAARLAVSVLAEARREGDPVAVCQALIILVYSHSKGSDLAAARRCGAEAVAIADGPAASDVYRVVPYQTFGAVLLELDELDAAREAVQRGRRQCVEFGTSVAVITHDFVLGFLGYFAGDWDNALADIETGMNDADRTMTGWRVDVLAIRAMIAIHRGRLGDAEADLALAEDGLAAGEPAYRPEWLFLARYLSLDAAGETERAQAVLANAWNLARAVGLPTAYPTLGPYVARWAVATGDLARAADVLDALEEVAAINPDVTRLRATARWCAGIVSNDPDALTDAVGLLRAGPRPLDTGLVCEDAAVVMAGADRLDAARALLAEATDVFERLQAWERVTGAAARLRSLGVRLGVRGVRSRPASGWESLTATEQRVVRLVADDLSNPQIALRLYVSRRTVETHVSHALAKLGCKTRRELAAYVTGRL